MSPAEANKTLAHPDTGLQAEPSSSGFGARRIPRETNVDALTPGNIKSLLQRAEDGDLAAQAELFTVMRERDGEMAAHFRTRTSAVARAGFEIEPDPDAPEGMEAQAEKAAEFAKEMVAQIGVRPNADPGVPMRGIRAGISDLLDAVAMGFAVLEIQWETTKAEWRPAELIWRPQWWFTSGADGQTLLVRPDQAGGDPEPMRPWKFLVHRVASQSGFIHQQALIRSCVRAFIVRLYSWKDWLAYAEVFGQPVRVGHLPEGTPWDSPEASQLWAALQGLGSDSAAMLSGDAVIEFLERKAGITAPFKELIEHAGRELTLAILGQTLTSGGEGGGSRALGQVHNEVRMDLAEGDAVALDETMRFGLLRPIVALNLGPGYPTPRWHTIIEKPKDLKALAETIGAAQKAGIQVPTVWAHNELGIPEPQDDEAVLVPVAAAPVQGAGSAAAGSQQSAVSSEQDGDGDDDDIRGGEDEAANSLGRDVLNQAEVEADGVLPEDGLAWLEERRVVTPGVWDELSPAGRQRAWFVGGLSAERIAQVGRQIMATIRGGQGEGEFLARLEALGISVTGAEEPADGQITAAHARLVHQQNTNAAYGADRWHKAWRDQELRPYGQYHTVGDGNVRASHAGLDGIVKLLTDPFWDKHTPPWQFRCRCSMTTLDELEMEADGLRVADDVEEAARYQAAQQMAGEEASPREFARAWRSQVPAMEGRENLDALKAPGEPDWTFSRRDAHWIGARGEAPATETGEADRTLLETMPLVSEVLD